MAKAVFNRKKTLFTSKFDLNLRKKLVNCCIWSNRTVWCLNFNTSEIRSEMPGDFLKCGAGEGCMQGTPATSRGISWLCELTR
jgi:hypothetical protein